MSNDRNKVDGKSTQTSYWASVMPTVGHPKYADSTIFEEGPELVEKDKAGDAGGTSIFNRAVAVELDKIFLPHLNVFDNAGDTVAAQITNVLKTRVGRNRSYTSAQVAEYLAVAGSKYAAMQGLKNAMKVCEMVPRIATVTDAFVTWRDLYDKYMNNININYPVPEDLAKFIDEYVVGIYEDKEDFFNKGLVVFVKTLELYSRVSKSHVQLQFMESPTLNLFTEYMNEAPLDSEIAIARDIASFAKTKQLTPISDAKTYSLDAKHRATLINTAKFASVSFDNGGVENGDDITARGPHISNSGNNGILRFVGAQNQDNINYWDALCRNKNVGYNDKNDLKDIAAMVAIDAVTMRTANGEDEERWNGRMVVGTAWKTSELDEFELMLNYIDLFGGFAYTHDSADQDETNPSLGTVEVAAQIESVGTKSYALTDQQLDAVKLIAMQEVFNLRLLVKENGEN